MMTMLRMLTGAVACAALPMRTALRALARTLTRPKLCGPSTVKLESGMTTKRNEYESPDWAVGQVVRETGLVEDTCEHGVGHPNIEWLKRHGSAGAGVHGCDGCCRRTAKTNQGAQTNR